jgi:hypothetical protein
MSRSGSVKFETKSTRSALIILHQLQVEERLIYHFDAQHGGGCCLISHLMRPSTCWHASIGFESQSGWSSSRPFSSDDLYAQDKLGSTGTGKVDVKGLVNYRSQSQSELVGSVDGHFLVSILHAFQLHPILFWAVIQELSQPLALERLYAQLSLLSLPKPIRVIWVVRWPSLVENFSWQDGQQ